MQRVIKFILIVSIFGVQYAAQFNLLYIHECLNKITFINVFQKQNVLDPDPEDPLLIDLMDSDR